MGRKLLLALVVFLLFSSVVEILLRRFHQRLPLPLSSFIATSYHSGVGGIYFHEPRLHMRLMKPHYQREMYYNGYRWQHRTDHMGFRNPQDRGQARVVLLGDSMIYGHGVNEQHTVRHHLEALTRQPVSNLGIQGGFCPPGAADPQGVRPEALPQGHRPLLPHQRHPRSVGRPLRGADAQLYSPGRRHNRATLL